MEACAMEIPCVVSPIPGNMELIEHNKTGLVAKRLNPQSFAAQLNRLVNDGNLRKKLGLKIVEHLLQKTIAQ